MPVIDIITELQYNANTDVLEAINNEFGTQIKQIKALQAENEKLQASIDRLGKDEVKNRKILNTLLDQNKRKIDDINTSIGKQFAGNQKLATSFVDVTGKLNGLRFAGSQLLREAPAFTFSIQTGILALSNNIPILLDQLKQAQAAGSTTGQIFKALGQSIFGLSGIITIAVSALTIFGDKIFDTGKKSKDAEKDVKDLTKAIQDQARAVNDAATLEGNRQDIGANAIKRRLDLLKAQGASEGEILKTQKEYNAALVRGYQNQIATYDVIKEQTRTAFNFFREQGLSDKTVREQTAGVVAGILQEQLKITKEQAEEEAKLIADTYNTRNSALATFTTEQTILNEKIKDLRNQDLVDEAAYNKKLTDDNKKRVDDLNKIKERISELAQEVNRLDARQYSKFLDDLDDANNKKLKQIEEDFKSLAESFRKNLSGTFGSQLTTGQSSALNQQLEQQQQKRANLDNQKLRNENAQAQKESDARRAKEQMAYYREIYKQQQKLDPNSPKSQAAKDDYRNARQKYRELNYIAQEENRATVDAIVQGSQVLISEVANIFDQIYSRQLEALDRQINVARERIDVAVELAKAGNAQILQEETNRLDALEKKREEIAQKQLQTNALLRASSAAIAAAQAIQVVTNAGATGDPYTTAARIAAAVAALAAGISFATSITEAFADGVVDYQGKGTGKSDSNIVRISKGESVITADATQKFKPMLEAMNAGTFTAMPVYNSNVSRHEMDGVNNRLDSLIEAVSMSSTKVNFNASPDGIRIMTETARRRDQNRFRR